MDFSYEFLMFQRGNHDTTEKLEYYENLIMILLRELKTLREAMCPCQQKCASSKATPSATQSLTTPSHSTRPLNRGHFENGRPTLPQMPKMNVARRTTPAPGLGYIPVNTAVASVSRSLVEMPTERNTLGNESNNCMFYAVRDSSANTTLDVTFVHSFRHEANVCCVCFSSDGRHIAAGTRHSSIFIYEVESHKKHCELREYASQYGSYARAIPYRLCFSSDGRYLAVVDGAKRITIWDVAKKRIRNIFHGSYRASEIRFSPDGRLIACCNIDTRFLVLNVRDKSRRMAYKGTCFDFSPNGRCIATGKKGVFAILDLRTGKAVKRWKGQGEYLRKVKFTSDGRGLLCVHDDMIEQWEVSDAEPVLIRKFDVPTDLFRSTSISPDLRLVALNNKLWDVDSGERQYALQGHTGSDLVYSIDFSSAGTYFVIGQWDGFVSLWKYS